MHTKCCTAFLKNSDNAWKYPFRWDRWSRNWQNPLGQLWKYGLYCLLLLPI